MEGYSVTEAASILGVPTERVWELLARGVLSGAAEGETGMRVYLQPRPAPPPPAVEQSRSNGNPAQREPDRELSPFRELLTEFRNLTERYGQALLALGEARGEVAALRSRVDLLEARMDLRLPMGGGMPAPTPWSAPTAEPAARPSPPEPRVGGDDEGEAVEPAGDDDRRARRRRSARHATESFAEALARAEDPTRPELPGAADAAAALAAIRAETGAEQTATDAALPRELPAAESMPIADQPAPRGPGAELETTPEAEPQPEAEPEPGAAESLPGTAPVAPAPAEPPPQEVAPITFDPDRYTVAIEEPDWWAEEDVLQAERPPEAGLPAVEVPSAATNAPEDEGDSTPHPAPPHEETMLWYGTARESAIEPASGGAEEMEVVGGSTGRPDRPVLPGASELDEALAALDALAGRAPAPASSEAEEAAPIERAAPEPAAQARSAPSAAVQPPPAKPEALRRPGWPLADRPPAPSVSTPASRAYRRLRRIFPG